MKKILLTNDDGYSSQGLLKLKDELGKKYQVITVAPSRERSAVSMALTLNRPLRIEEVKKNFYRIDGTPSDCINIAMRELLDELPDMVVSGMNLGENLSEDIFYSGTVGGAISGHFYGVCSIAVSLMTPEKRYLPDGYDFESGVRLTSRVVDKLLDKKLSGVVFNMNIPHGSDGKIIVTALGNKRYTPNIVSRTDPRGKKYYWIGTGDPVREGIEGTDIWAVENNHVSLTPLKYDLKCFNNTDDFRGLFDES